MQFKDLSYWGIFKLSLIFEAIIPVILAPFLFMLYLVKPERFSYDGEIKFLGATITIDDKLIVTIILLVTLTLLALIIKSAIWYGLAQKTPLGRVRISN